MQIRNRTLSLFLYACKKVCYSVVAYNNKTSILGVYWTAVKTFFQAGKGMSSDVKWGGEREASFSKVACPIF